jgi:cell division protein FtsW (lipid II flippase)
MFQTEFFSYLQLGFNHISDLGAYDHILFVTALCALSDVRQWRHLLWLVTSFTLGHSVTLALSTLNILTFPGRIVEFLIPVTIFATACVNVVALSKRHDFFEQNIANGKGAGHEFTKYAMAVGFGFIHGMGFSTFLKSLLGKEASITLPLFAFNVGLEIGQMMIVGCLLLLTLFVTRLLRVAQRDWALIVSGAALGIALTLMLKNFPS